MKIHKTPTPLKMLFGILRLVHTYFAAKTHILENICSVTTSTILITCCVVSRKKIMSINKYAQITLHKWQNRIIIQPRCKKQMPKATK